MSKQELRIWAKEKRNKLDNTAISKKAVEKIKDSEEYKSAQNIMIFYPLHNEINLLDLTKDIDKKFYLPKIQDKNLLCCPFERNAELRESCFRTKEPLTTPVNKNIIDLVIIPALAADKNGFRLGYGGGFYDRFLANTNIKKITCIPEELIVETIYPESHDIAIDKIIVI